MTKLLWQRLRITTDEVRSAAVEDGADHIGAVCRALDVLPSAVAEHKKDVSERNLLCHAACQKAKFVTSIARRIADHLNPDGVFDGNDRARRRGLTLAPQGPDGMSRLPGWLDPEARAYLEAVNAAVRPGRHNPIPTNTKRPSAIREVARSGYMTP